MQEYLILVEWKGLELSSTEGMCKAIVKKFVRSSTAWAAWIELKENLAKFPAVRGKKTSDDKGSDDMTSKAEHKQKSDASIVEFCRRSLAGSNVLEFLADLLKIMKLRKVGADDGKEVQETLQHLFTNFVKPARTKLNSQQATPHVDHLLFQLKMHLMWDANPFLDRAQELVKEAIDEHANHNTAELDRSLQVKKRAERIKTTW